MAAARAPLPAKTLRLVSMALFAGSGVFLLVGVVLTLMGQPWSLSLVFVGAALIDLMVAFVFKAKAERAEEDMS